MAAIPIGRDAAVWGRLRMRVWPVRLRELGTVQLRDLHNFYIELLRVGSYEDDQLKVLKPVFCVFVGSNVNLECHIKWGFECWPVAWRTD